MRFYMDRALRGTAHLLSDVDGVRKYEIRNHNNEVVAYEEHSKGSKPMLVKIVKPVDKEEPPV